MSHLYATAIIGCGALLVGLAATAPAQTTPRDAGVPTDGLILWIEAADRSTLTLEGDLVSAWASKAPGSQVVLRAQGDRRPKLTAPVGRGPHKAISFDGRNDILRHLGFGRRAREWTLIALLAPLRPARGAILSACPDGGNDFDPGLVVDLYESTARFDYLSVEGAGRQGGRMNQRNGATPFGVFTVVSVTRDDSQIRLHIDGVLEGVRSVSPAETVMQDIRIGARYYAEREVEFLKGELAEVLLYDRTLSEFERRGIEGPRIASQKQRKLGEEYGLAMAHKADRERMIPPRVIHRWPTVAAYVAAREDDDIEFGPALPIARLPVRRDLLQAIRLCMQCLNNSFDRDRDDEPFFYSNHRPDGTGRFHHSVNIGIPHVVGRCLLGNMAATLATELPFPPDGLAVLTRYLKSSFDNPDHLNSYIDPARDGARKVEMHNMREGLYGLWALMHTEQAVWARQKAAAMLRTLDRITDDQGRWSAALIQAAGMAERVEGAGVPNAARMVDPLLAVHRVTADPVALKLAGAYARAGLQELLTEEGHFTQWTRSSGHVHSITSALSGIVEFGLLTGDEDIVEGCVKAMQVGVPEYFSSWGWGDEVFPDHPADEVSRGEINQTGDVIRAALHLGAAAHAGYYELAERYLRSMLLPTQHTEETLRAFMRDNPQPNGDAERDVIARSAGGFSMQLPNDRMREGDWPIQTQDITSGAAHALAECWRHRVTFHGDTASVNLLLDYEGDGLRVTSALPLDGIINFRADKPLRLRIRKPGWVHTDTLGVTVNGVPRDLAIDEEYVGVGALAAGDEGSVRFAVPCRVECETVDGTSYTTTWLGNQIVDIRPRGSVSPLPF